MGATCDARIRPLLAAIDIACEVDGPHDQHQGILRDYAYPGSATVFQWQERDRRTFHGEWPGACGHPTCVLPAGHRGEHA